MQVQAGGGAVVGRGLGHGSGVGHGADPGGWPRRWVAGDGCKARATGEEVGRRWTSL